jgi:predicted membrane protein
MATIALPLGVRHLAISGTTIPLALGLVGVALTWFGAAWDVSWHRLIGRDTFWSAPHLFLYGGISLWGLASLVATITAMRGRPVRGRELRIGPLRAELGLALVGIAAALVIASAPFDDAWHLAFGRDIDIWSPPHLAGVAGSALAFVGWSVAFAPGVFAISEGLRRILRALMVANVCAVLVFGMNFYYILSVTREGFFYPLVVALTIPAGLAFGAGMLGGRWGATMTAVAYTGAALVTYAILAGGGWLAPAFPPLFLAGAIAIDVLRARGGRMAHPLALGAAFTVAFVIAEFFRMLLFPAMPPSGTGDGLDPRATALYYQYYAQAVARPLLSLWPVAAAVLGAPLAAASWLVGGRIAVALADDRDAELAHQ